LLRGDDGCGDQQSDGKKEIISHVNIVNASLSWAANGANYSF
jgi:hypothetical protein